MQTLKLSPRCAADTIDDTAAGSEGTLMAMPSTVRLRVQRYWRFHHVDLLMMIWSRDAFTLDDRHAHCFATGTVSRKISRLGIVTKSN